MNEIAIFPLRSTSLMSYELLIDEELIWRDRAYGILVSTPLGSTAYALSAGGIVILEDANVMEIVPVNSLEPSKRPIIVPDYSIIEIKGLASRYPCEAIADGCKRVRVKNSIIVKKSDKPLNIIRIASKPSVKKTLREKLLHNLVNMPPSVKFVLKMLQLNGPMSARELAEATLLPERTVRYALSELVKTRLVRKIINLRDARQIYYEAINKLPE